MNSLPCRRLALLVATLTFGLEPASAQPPEYSCQAQTPVGSGQLAAGRWFTDAGKPVPPMYPWYSPLAWHIFQSHVARPGLDDVRVEFLPPTAGLNRARQSYLGVAYTYLGSDDVWLVARMGDAVWRKRFQRGRQFNLQLRGAAFDQAFARGDALEIYLQRADGAVLDSRREPMAERGEAASLAAQLWSDVEARAAHFETHCTRSITIE